MAGEFANNAMQDQELMARTSPQDLYRTANLVGAAGGAMDTVLPGIIGHQLTGGALRAGIKGMGPAAKTALGMLGEGGTELTQGEAGRYALGYLNPNRDTSEDASNRLNEAAGGAAGGGPLIAAGAYADAGFRRVGHTADQIGTKAGEVYDMAKEQYEGSALERGVDAAGAKAKGLFNRGKDEVIDLYEAAKDEDGKVAEEEKIFTIQRDVTGPDQGQYQIAGYGPYHGYHSPMWDIASGMLLGSMMMSVFSPGYRPLYTTPYTTPVSRRGQLVTQRNSWRQSNPEAFNKRASKSGRSYGAKGGGFGGGKPSPSPRPRMPSRGGGRFGLRRAPAHAPTRLLA